LRRKLPEFASNRTEIAHKRGKYDARAEIRLLKAQIIGIQEQLNSLTEAFRQSSPPPSFSPKSPAGKRKSDVSRGPKKRHSAIIYEERDFIVRLLEGQWMRIEPHCGKWADKGLKLAEPPDMIQIRKILTGLLSPSNFQIAETAKKLLDRLGYLEKFLTEPKMRRRFSGNPERARNRFGGDPRQIANALAGVPKVGIWRSLRLCEQKNHRCKVNMPDEAIPSYLRRKHPALARALNASGGLPFIASFYRSYVRRRDPFLLHIKAVDLQRLWQVYTGR
jgi:hypothetical protein